MIEKCEKKSNFKREREWMEGMEVKKLLDKGNCYGPIFKHNLSIYEK